MIDFYFKIGGGAFVLTLLLGVLVLWIFPRIGLLDRPEKYGLKRRPLPYPGGVILLVSFVVLALILVPLSKALMGIVLGAVLLVGVSFWDDLKGVSPWWRLLVQLMAGGILVYSGTAITYVNSPFGGGIDLMVWAGLPFIATLIWVVLFTNTVNWLDGIPGLASGVSTIGFLVIFLLSIRPDFHVIDQSQLIILSLILLGASLAFWFFDFPSPKILLGDSGSMFLGYMLAVMAIFAGGKLATAFLVLGVPLLDAFWVILRRIWQRKSPLKGDFGHFHHRLLKAGLKTRSALIILYFICAMFGGIALFLNSWQKLVAIGILLGVMALIGGGLVWRERKK